MLGEVDELAQIPFQRQANSLPEYKRNNSKNRATWGTPSSQIGK
jgi:hypothetical protein